jgi:hypothetical protein
MAIKSRVNTAQATVKQETVPIQNGMLDRTVAEESESARSKVFETYELIEAILLQASNATALKAQAVNATFQYVINRSTRLQQKLFFQSPPVAQANKPNEEDPQWNPLFLLEIVGPLRGDQTWSNLGAFWAPTSATAWHHPTDRRPDTWFSFRTSNPDAARSPRSGRRAYLRLPGAPAGEGASRFGQGGFGPRPGSWQRMQLGRFKTQGQKLMVNVRLPGLTSEVVYMVRTGTELTMERVWKPLLDRSMAAVEASFVERRRMEDQWWRAWREELGQRLNFRG